MLTSPKAKANTAALVTIVVSGLGQVGALSWLGGTAQHVAQLVLVPVTGLAAYYGVFQVPNAPTQRDSHPSFPATPRSGSLVGSGPLPKYDDGTGE